MKKRYILTVEIETTREKDDLNYPDCLGLDKGDTEITGILNCTKIHYSKNATPAVNVMAMRKALNKHISEMRDAELQDN